MSPAGELTELRASAQLGRGEIVTHSNLLDTVLVLPGADRDIPINAMPLNIPHLRGGERELGGGLCVAS